MFESVLQPVKAQLLAVGVQQLGVFGSVARGTARGDSDVDVLIRFRSDARTYDNLVVVGDALESAFGRSVDLVTTDALSPYLAPHILSEIKYVDLRS